MSVKNSQNRQTKLFETNNNYNKIQSMQLQIKYYSKQNKRLLESNQMLKKQLNEAEQIICQLQDKIVIIQGILQDKANQNKLSKQLTKNEYNQFSLVKQDLLKLANLINHNFQLLSRDVNILKQQSFNQLSQLLKPFLQSQIINLKKKVTNLQLQNQMINYRLTQQFQLIDDLRAKLKQRNQALRQLVGDVKNKKNKRQSKQNIKNNPNQRQRYQCLMSKRSTNLI